MKLIRVVGARPQFMQAAVLRPELNRRGHQEILIHTGQHYEHSMSQVFFEEFQLPKPDFNLSIGSDRQGAQTGRMLMALEEVIIQHDVTALIVDGDTNSTLAGALAAAKLHLPVVHVEAGLRSFDRRMPEEVNRIVTDHVSEVLCAPTVTALQNLEREGLSHRAVLTGDLMYDCFLHFRTKAQYDILNKLELTPKDYLLATVHRSENVDNPKVLYGILSALADMPLKVVLPVHPRIRSLLQDYIQQGGQLGAIKAIPPVSYLEMIALESKARCILTDSGGVQREAFFVKIPSVILRDTSEWQEQIDSGLSILAGTEYHYIMQSYEKALDQIPDINPADVYGDGQAASKVVSAIEQRFA